MQRFTVRSADLSDLTHIMELQNLAYLPELREEYAVFESRIRIAPNLCFLADLEGDLAGYVIAHPWPDRTTPGLGRVIEAIPEGADAIHIHDLAVNPAFRGLGVARALLDRLQEAAIEQSTTFTLVAVQGASEFWKHAGFEDDRAAQGYDAGARLMRGRMS